MGNSTSTKACADVWDTWTDVRILPQLSSSTTEVLDAPERALDALIIAAQENLFVSDERIEGFTRGFLSAGGRQPRIRRQGFDWNAGYEAMIDELARGVEPGTLVVGITDVIAIGAMNAIREAGREPGCDIAVAGTDNIPTSRDMWPPLTTVHLSLQMLGRRAVRAVTQDDWVQPEPVPALVQLRASTPGLK